MLSRDNGSTRVVTKVKRIVVGSVVSKEEGELLNLFKGWPASVKVSLNVLIYQKYLVIEEFAFLPVAN